jgi:hypothetical protein
MTHLAPSGRYAPQASFQAIVKPLAELVTPVDRIATAIAWSASALLAFALAARAVTLLRARLLEGWIWLALSGWLLIPNPYPWYALWLIAIAALAPRTRVAFAALLLATASLLRYAPDAIGAPSPLVAVALGIAASFPFVLLAVVKEPADHKLVKIG